MEATTKMRRPGRRFSEVIVIEDEAAQARFDFIVATEVTFDRCRPYRLLNITLA